MFHVRACAWLAVVSLLLSTHPAAAQTPAKPADATAIAALIAQLGNADFQQRQTATRSLEAIGRPALAALRDAAEKHDDAEVRRRAKGLVEKIENSLEQLLEDYKSYGLPLPPKDAPLVRFVSGGGGKVNGVVQPLEYSLGFLLKPGAKRESADILFGTRSYQPGSNSPVTVLAAGKATTQEMEAWVKDSQSRWLPLAIQCQSRGWHALAQAIFEKASNSPNADGAKQMLRNEAWLYWKVQLHEPGTDWQTAAKHLRGLIRADPEFDTQRNRALLKSLDLALQPSKAKPGSIEAMIDALINEVSVEAGFREKGDSPYVQLVEKGFDAVPALIEHLDDDRLTRYCWFGLNNFPGYQYRVGHIASNLLEGLAGENLGEDGLRAARGNVAAKDKARAWWDKAKKEGEEAYMLGRVFLRKGDWPNDYALRVLVKKYPRRLPEVYRTLLDKRPQMQSRPVVEALARSEVPREKKLELYAYAGHHKNLEHRRAAFWQLKELDHERFVQLLIETLDGLVPTPAEPYWLCSEAAFANLVASTETAAAWQALKRAAKRADPGLRVEILNVMSYAGEGKQRKQRLDFLAAFLDDVTVRDVRSDPKRFTGPYAEDNFERLEIRNCAAIQIAWILEMDKKPQPSWDAEQWARFRDEVREALQR
jgi:hypothetical protein